ncbi:unnamed protein product [Diplocarpon coronariae]
MGISGSTHRRSFQQLLPAELQTMIWSLAAMNIPPRLIEIRYERPTSRLEQYIRLFRPTRTYFRDDSLNLYSPCRIPNVLHICMESRRIALQFFELSFGVYGPGGSHIDKIFINWEKDTVHFGDRVNFDDVLHGTSRVTPLIRTVKGIDRVQRWSAVTELTLVSRNVKLPPGWQTMIGSQNIACLMWSMWKLGREPSLKHVDKTDSAERNRLGTQLLRGVATIVFWENAEVVLNGQSQESPGWSVEIGEVHCGTADLGFHGDYFSIVLALCFMFLFIGAIPALSSYE